MEWYGMVCNGLGRGGGKVFEGQKETEIARYVYRLEGWGSF